MLLDRVHAFLIHSVFVLGFPVGAKVLSSQQAKLARSLLPPLNHIFHSIQLIHKS
jgi:hypothetical protein